MDCVNKIIFQQIKARGWEKDLGVLVPLRRGWASRCLCWHLHVPANLGMGEFLWELVQEVQVCIPPIWVKYGKHTFIAKEGTNPLMPRTPRSRRAVS